jgi:prevent-host-death family protein
MTYIEVRVTFETVLKQAQTEDIEIQKNGKSIAVLMSYDRYKKLEEMKSVLLEFCARDLTK